MEKAIETFIPQTGDIAFYHDYKEPLEPLENGYGWKGILLHSSSNGADTDRVLCSFCGRWFKQITGRHVRKHGFSNLAEYKVEYGLGSQTALITETLRNRRVIFSSENNTGKQLRQWRENNPGRYSEMLSNNGKKNTGHRMSDEDKNKRGICKAQIIAAYQNEVQRLGKPPSAYYLEKQAPWLDAAIRYHMGGYRAMQNLLQIAATKRMPGEITNEILLEDAKDFKKRWQRLPHASDIRRGLLFGRSVKQYQHRFGSWLAFLKGAGFKIEYPWQKGAEIERLYLLSGLTAKQVGERVGYAGSTVIRTLRRRGVPIRPPHRGYTNDERKLL